MILSDREIELIDGMIEVHKRHMVRGATMLNTAMASKQMGWDMERVALLERIKKSSFRLCHIHNEPDSNQCPKCNKDY